MLQALGWYPEFFMIQPLPTSSVLTPFILLSDPALQPYWTTLRSWLQWVFIDLYVIAYAVSSVTYPRFAFICWVRPMDLLKSWFLTWVYTSFLSWAKCFSCRVLPHPLPALIITELYVSVYWSLFHHEMWDPLSHACCYHSIPKAEHSFWFIIDFNRKQRDFKKKLSDINTCSLVLRVALLRKLFIWEIFLPSCLVRIF